MTTRPYQAKFRLSPDNRGAIFRCLAPNASLGNRSKVQQRDFEEGNESRAIPPTPLKAGWGGLGNKPKMSRKSKQSVREILASMELEYGIENCIFPTLTLPTVDISAYEGMARYSSYICNRLGMILDRYFCPELFPNMSRAFIWEYQDRGALHLHIGIASYCMDAISKSDFERFLRKKWIEILEDLSEKYGCNCFINAKGREWDRWELLEGYIDKKGVLSEEIPQALCKVEFVRKSIVAYLSGYLSGSNHDDNSDKKNQLRERFYPIATWAQWNRQATKLRQKWTIEIDFGYIEKEQLEAFDDCIEVIDSCIERIDELPSLPSKNPYVVGRFFLSDRAKFDSSIIKDFARDMRKVGITRGIISYLKDSFDYQILEEYRKEKIGYKDARSLLEWNEVRRYKRRKANQAKNHFIAINGLFDLIKRIGDIVDIQYPVYEQLRLNYGLET